MTALLPSTMASFEKRNPIELIDKWASYLPPPRAASLRQTCVGASLQTLGKILRPYFTTWKTSLMHSSLENLKSISNDDHIRDIIEILVIEDDTSRLDPWASSELPSPHKSYDIWPRDDAGLVLTSELAISDLQTILREKKFPHLQQLKIRDYSISPMNFRFCDEMLHAKDLLDTTTGERKASAAVASFARDMLENAMADLLLTDLEIGSGDLPLAEDSAIHSSRFKDQIKTSVLGSPRIHEATMSFKSHELPLPPQQQQQQEIHQFSLLSSAKLFLPGGDHDATTIFWLEKTLSSSAISLQTLKLSFTNPLSLSIREKITASPRLKEFTLSSTATSTEDILAILSSCKSSLEEITFRQVTLLDDGSPWSELLSFVAMEFPALKAFYLSVLREKERGSLAVDFLNRVGTDELDESREGLSVIERGTGETRRITTVGYRGVGARVVLGVLARH